MVHIKLVPEHIVAQSTQELLKSNKNLQTSQRYYPTLAGTRGWNYVRAMDYHAVHEDDTRGVTTFYSEFGMEYGGHAPGELCVMTNSGRGIDRKLLRLPVGEDIFYGKYSRGY